MDRDRASESKRESEKESVCAFMAGRVYERVCVRECVCLCTCVCKNHYFVCKYHYYVRVNVNVWVCIQTLTASTEPSDARVTASSEAHKVPGPTYVTSARAIF